MITLTATITISDGLIIELNNKNILSIESNNFDRKDISLPSWGLISNDGNIKIVDYDRTIQRLLSTSKLNQETKVVVKLNNSLTKSSSQVGEFFVVGWDYDYDNKIAIAKLSDGMEKMQSVTLPKTEPLNLGKDLRFEARSIYENLRRETISLGFDMTSSENLDETTLKHLEDYLFYNYYKSEKTLWRAWQDFCEALQLYIFRDKNGKISCVYKEGD